MTYEEFIAQKRITAPPVGIPDPPPLNPSLFGFQSAATRWALQRGRAALWEDCGLGKSWQALEWSRVIHEHTQGDVLILTPLAVARQFVDEGNKMGVSVTHAREADDVRPGINVTNYERVHKFDAGDFAGIVADESSILKDYTSATRNQLIEMFAQTPYRLACTATPAPNDHMELGNHAEFLGIMTRVEMLAMFFTHDGGDTSKWRLKGHAVKDFWRWVASWALSIRRPSDVGFDDAGFELPPLNMHEHVVSADLGLARKQGSLFVLEARGLEEQRMARRGTLAARCRIAADLVMAEPSDQWIVWCDLNDESSMLASLIPGSVEVSGADSNDAKEEKMAQFISGAARVLVSKPSIAGYGLNLQNCARACFVGLSNSFEAWYQAIRRNYRFGQKRAVECHMITSDAEGAVVSNLKRKQVDAERMAQKMIEATADFAKRNLNASGRDQTEYNPQFPMTVPSWIGVEQ